MEVTRFLIYLLYSLLGYYRDLLHFLLIKSLFTSIKPSYLIFSTLVSLLVLIIYSAIIFINLELEPFPFFNHYHQSLNLKDFFIKYFKQFALFVCHYFLNSFFSYLHRPLFIHVLHHFQRICLKHHFSSL